jgi:L-malate glycosyltransferase
MKILIVINALIVGGAEKQAVMDANNLSLRGHDVTIAYQKGGMYEDLLSPNISRLSIKFKNEIFASLELLINVLTNKYDVIHTHMFWAHKVATLPAVCTRRKLFFNEHGLGVWRKWYHIVIMRFISLFADKIINSCNATQLNRVKIDKIPPDKLVTVYNSFDNYTNTRLSDKKNGTFNIGFIGRFDPVKRLHLFIDIATLLKDKIKNVKFILVGDGIEKERIEKLINSHNLQDYFILTGYIVSPLVYLSNMDVIFMPSEREGFSLALLEAGAHGIPAIAFDVGGNPEIITDQSTGYIVSDTDINEVANRILYFYENPMEKIKMGQQANLFISSQFSIDKRMNKLEELYQHP